MPLDLLLINPGGRATIYQGLGDELTAIEPPLWCRLIAGYCMDRGHSVEILDAGALELTRDDVVLHALRVKPRLVALVAHGHQPSASAQTMALVIETCGMMKTHGLEAQVALTGGATVAVSDWEIRNRNIDWLVKGEGAVQIERILNGEAGRPHYRRRLPEPSLLDLDADLHGNAWHLLPMAEYRAHNWQCFDGSPRQPYASIYTSLGCPFRCSFCCINAPFGGPGYRTRSADAVVEEVKMLYHAHGVRTLKITDEMFVLKPSHYLPICERLAALSFADELNIWAYARIDTVKPNTLELMRRAGIRWLALGIESGSAHVRDGAEKSLNDQDISETVAAIQRAGINVIGNFIFGLPDDTLETMGATLSLAQSLDLDFANFYSAMAYPGSKLFAEADPAVLPKAWSGYSQHSVDTTPLPTATLSSRDVLGFRDDAFHAYFEDPRYLDRIGRKFDDFAVDEVRAMTAHRLERAA